MRLPSPAVNKPGSLLRRQPVSRCGSATVRALGSFGEGVRRRAPARPGLRAPALSRAALPPPRPPDPFTHPRLLPPSLSSVGPGGVTFPHRHPPPTTPLPRSPNALRPATPILPPPLPSLRPRRAPCLGPPTLRPPPDTLPPPLPFRAPVIYVLPPPGSPRGPTAGDTPSPSYTLVLGNLGLLE